MSTDIITRVGWDTSPAEAGQKKAIALAEGYATKAAAAGAKADKGLLGGLGKGMSGASSIAGFGLIGTAVTTATAGVVALGTVMLHSIGHYRELNEEAEKLNATAESTQKLDLFGTRTNTSVDTLVSGLLKMNKALSDPENEKGAKALSDLGVSMSALVKMQPDQQIMALAGAFQRAQETGQGFHQIYDLIGKTAGELIPVLRTTKAQFADLNAQPILNDAQVERLDEAGAKLAILGKKAQYAGAEATLALLGINERIADGLVPEMKKVADQWSEFADNIGITPGMKKVSDWFKEMAGNNDKTHKPATPKGPLISPGPTKEEQKKAATALQGKLAIGEELKMLAAKATGNDRLIKQAEREVQIAAKKQELMKKAGLDPKEAEKTAKLMADLEDKAARKANGGFSDKIVTQPNKPRATFAGLDAFEERQRRETVTKHFADGHTQQFPNPNGRRVHKPGDDQGVAGAVPPPHKDPGGPNASRKLEEIMNDVKQLIDQRLKVAY